MTAVGVLTGICLALGFVAAVACVCNAWHRDRWQAEQRKRAHIEDALPGLLSAAYRAGWNAATVVSRAGATPFLLSAEQVADRIGDEAEAWLRGGGR